MKRRVALAALSSLWLCGCGQGALGEVSLERRDDERSEQVQSLRGVAYASREASRFAPHGLLLFFEVGSSDARSIQLELDLPRTDDHAPHASYVESVAGETAFAGGRVTGYVEMIEDLDGLACACAEAAFALRIRDDGPDGQSGSDDDRIVELRNGRYRLGPGVCPQGRAQASDPPSAAALELRAVDPCLAREGREPSAPPAAAGPAAPSVRSSQPRASSAGPLYEPRYGPDAPPYGTRPSYVEPSYGCGCGAPAARSEPDSAGCQGERSSGASTSAAGCQGDDPESDESATSGCQGDEPESSGCDGDSPMRATTAGLSGPGQNYLWFVLALILRARRASDLLSARPRPGPRRRGEVGSPSVERRRS